MSDIEMRAFGTAASWYKGSTNDAYHNNTDAKYRAALKLATFPEKGKAVLPESSLKNRNYFLAHWGEDDSESISRYAYLTLLTWQVKDAVKQPIIVLHEGKFEDIPEPDGYSYETIKFRTGKIVTDEIEHGIGFNRDNKGPKRQNVKPPYLSYGLQVVVNNLHTVEVDFLSGSCDVKKSEDTESLIAVYLGTVSLLNDLDEYHATKNLIERPYVTGNAPCTNVLETINAATNHSLSQYPGLMDQKGK
jgi:hypothetical protein